MTNDSELDPTVLAFVEAHNVRDWESVRALVVEGFAFVDRRPAGVATGSGVADYITLQKTGIEMVPDRRISFAQAVSPRVVSIRADGTDEFGNSVEWEFIAVFQVKGGRIARMEIFHPESVDEATERARALI
jgi:hypothetical protein